MKGLGMVSASLAGPATDTRIAGPPAMARWRPGRHGGRIRFSPETLRHRLSTVLLWAAMDVGDPAGASPRSRVARSHHRGANTVHGAVAGRTSGATPFTTGAWPRDVADRISAEVDVERGDSQGARQ